MRAEGAPACVFVVSSSRRPVVLPPKAARAGGAVNDR